MADQRFHTENTVSGRTGTVLAVGGGPAGMAAALAAAEAGAAVTLLERRPRPGKKLLATGNGRCNLANRGRPVYFGDARFARRALAALPPEMLLRRLEAWGLPLYTDPEQRVYPATQQAASVLSVLCARLAEARVQLVTDADVLDVKRTGGAFAVLTRDGRRWSADRVILATGGLAGGALGSRPEDYALASNLGHPVTDRFPGLTPLTVAPGPFRKLSGLRMPARIGLYAGGLPQAASAGEILLTDDGVSGICAMQLARDAHRLIGEGLAPELRLDLSPVFFPEERAYCRLPGGMPDTYARTLALLRERQAAFGPAGVLPGLVPEKLIPLCPAGSPERLAAFLTDTRLRVTGTRPMAQAQVTCGGVDTRTVDPETMASRLCPGLYLAGELLDVDGDCGGFNIQFALITGLLAGRAAAEQGHRP